MEALEGQLKQLRVALTEGARKNGYIPIPGDQDIFGDHTFGGSNDNEQSSPITFHLPDGEILHTDIRSPSGRGGRIRARFYKIFDQLNVQPGDFAVINPLPGLDEFTLSFESKSMETIEPGAQEMTKISLNQILYGPPGTGKTYATVNKALEVLDPEFADANRDNRFALRKRFKELSDQGRVEFVTFHQSFSYEDFVEGLRATSEDGKISYDVDDGVFKLICILDQAKIEKGTDTDIDITNRKIWKMSLGDTQGDDSYIYEHCIEHNEIRLGYGRGLDFSSVNSANEIANIYQNEGITVKPQDYGVSSVNTFKNIISIGDLIVVSDGNKKFRAIGEVKGDYQFRPDDNLMHYAQRRPVTWHKVWDRSLPYDQLRNKAFSQMTLYQLQPKRVRADKLLELLGAGPATTSDSTLSAPLKVGTSISNGRYEVSYVSNDLVRVHI